MLAAYSRFQVEDQALHVLHTGPTITRLSDILTTCVEQC